MYGFDEFACSLNEPEEGVAPTDSRLRPDIRIMEQQDFDGANSEKVLNCCFLNQCTGYDITAIRLSWKTSSVLGGEKGKHWLPKQLKLLLQEEWKKRRI